MQILLICLTQETVYKTHEVSRLQPNEKIRNISIAKEVLKEDCSLGEASGNLSTADYEFL